MATKLILIEISLLFSKSCYRQNGDIPYMQSQEFIVGLTEILDDLNKMQ